MIRIIHLFCKALKVCIQALRSWLIFRPNFRVNLNNLLAFALFGQASLFKDEVECVSFKQVEKRGSQITKWCVTTRRHVIEIPPPTNISSQSSNPIIFLTRHNTQKLPLSMFLQHFRTFNGCSMPIHTILQVQFLSNNIFLDVYKIQPKSHPDLCIESNK